MGFTTAVWALFVVFMVIFVFWARSPHGKTKIKERLENDPQWARRRIIRKKATNGKPRPALKRRKPPRRVSK